MQFRPERPSDAEAIQAIVTSAFESAPHSDGTEAAIVERLRTNGALTLSLVAECEGEAVGHVAFSPVTINGVHTDWLGLAPIAILPIWQRKGIGEALVRSGLDRIAAMDAAGCVVLGDPAFYRRFGFVSDAALRYADVPTEYFQRLVLRGKAPAGIVDYHASFSGN